MDGAESIRKSLFWGVRGTPLMYLYLLTSLLILIIIDCGKEFADNYPDFLKPWKTGELVG